MKHHLANEEAVLPKICLVSARQRSTNELKKHYGRFHRNVPYRESHNAAFQKFWYCIVAFVFAITKARVVTNGRFL